MSWAPATATAIRSTRASTALMEPSPPVMAVSLEGFLDDRQGHLGRLKLINLHGLAFQLLVVLEEAAQHRQAVRRQLRGLVEDVVFRIVHRHGEDLVVALATVNH